MRFKVDENLPIEIAELLVEAGYDAITVPAQALQGSDDHILIEVCRRESRILVTLDLDFADIRSYPPHSVPGLVVLRLSSQDKHRLIAVFRQALPLLVGETLEHRLWIVEESRVRIRGASQ